MDQLDSSVVTTDATPVEVSATTAAAATGDRRAYHEAATARRLGKPLDNVAITPATDTAPAAVTSPDKKLSNRMQRDEDRTREAVERATAELRAENERLKAERTPPKVAAPVVAQPAADTAPDPADTAKYPAGEYDPKFLRDIAAFEARDVLRKEKAETASRVEADAAAAADHARVSTYIDRVKAHVTTEPEFWSHVTTEVANIKPLGSLTPDERNPNGALGPDAQRKAQAVLTDALIADRLVASPAVAGLMKVLSKADAQGVPNAELRRLQAGPDSLATLPAGQRTTEHHLWIIEELAKLSTQVGSVAATSPAPKTATSAPPPATVLGSRPASVADPMKAALAMPEGADRTRAFRAAKLAKLSGTRR